jgi:putative hemolysin
VDQSSSLVLGKLMAVLGLVAANGFFVAAEFSLVGIRHSRIDELVAQGQARAGLLRRTVDNLDANLAATQLGVTISSLGLGWIGEPALARLIEPAFVSLGALAETASHAIAVAVAFCIITVFHIVLGELAPKSFALQRPERTALWIVRPLSLFLALFRPVIFLLNGLGNAVVRACGLEPGNAEGRLHSTEELKLLVAASRNAGLVEQAQQEVVERAFGMGERRIRTIMTPRHDIYWVDANGSAEAMLKGIRGSRHEQIVVARGTLDQVVGVLRKQDLLDLHLDGKLLPDMNGGSDLLAAVRDPLVVHDGATVLQVLETFRNRSIQMALIVDEYGALRGVVTQIDLLEALAGEIKDDDELDVTRREDGSFLVDATMAIQDAFEQLGMTSIPDDHSEYRTLAGFILRRLGHIPAVGEQFEWEADGDVRRFEVADVDGHRIDKVIVSAAKSQSASIVVIADAPVSPHEASRETPQSAPLAFPRPISGP